MKAFPTPAFVRLILDSGLWFENVSTRPSGADTQLPAARVTLIRDAEPDQPWTTAVCQVDVWDSTDYAAGDLAFRLASFWQSVTAQDIDVVHVTGGWVESSPRPFDDPDTDAARYILELGLIISEE